MSPGVEGFDLGAYRSRQPKVSEEEHFPVRIPFPETDDYGTPVLDEDGEPVTYTETILIPPLKNWPLDCQEMIGQGQVSAAIMEIVGEEGAEVFRRARWTNGEFEALFEVLSRWPGFQMGRPSARPPRRGSTLT